MRLQTLILFLLLCVASAVAKDVITKTDGTKIDAKVEEITESVIKYRKASNPTGPVYTIAKELVATVLYENGDIDTFQSSIPYSSFNKNVTTPSDDDLLRLAASDTYDNSENMGSVSDSQLLNMSYDKSISLFDLQSKAESYRKIAWIGGCSWLACGVVASAILSSVNGLSWYWGVTLPISIGVGAIWFYGFNAKAKSLMKKAKHLESYSSILIENEILRFRDNSLTAGINVMGNRMVNSHSLGLTLGLNF